MVRRELGGGVGGEMVGKERAPRLRGGDAHQAVNYLIDRSIEQRRRRWPQGHAYR